MQGERSVLCVRWGMVGGGVTVCCCVRWRRVRMVLAAPYACVLMLMVGMRGGRARGAGDGRWRRAHRHARGAHRHGRAVRAAGASVCVCVWF